MAAYGSGYYGRGVYGIGNVVISGNASTLAIGTLGVNISEQEEGTIATGNVGSVSVSRTIALTGNASTLSRGTLSLDDRSFAVTGNHSTLSIGSVTNGISVEIIGNEITCSVGTMIGFGWSTIPDTAETWTAEADTAETWTEISDNSETWTQVPA